MPVGDMTVCTDCGGDCGSWLLEHDTMTTWTNWSECTTCKGRGWAVEKDA